MKYKILLWICLIICISYSAYSIPDRGYVYFDCNGDVVDQWSNIEATWGGTGQLFSLDVPNFNISGNGGNQSCDFNTNNYLVSNIKPNVNNFTIDFWFNPDASSATNGLAATITNVGTDRLGFSLLTAAGNIEATIYNSGGPNNFLSGQDAKGGVWTKYTYVYTNVSGIGTSDFYINGTYAGSVTAMISSFFDVIHFGSQFASLPLTNSLNGKLDEIRVFNRTLNTSEIQQLYNYGKLENDTIVANFTITSNINNFSVNINNINFNTTDCFQETANLSHLNDGDCNLNYTGKYTLINSGFRSGLQIEYIKPNTPYLNNALWKYKINDSTGYVNIKDCFNSYNEKVLLKIDVFESGVIGSDIINGSCYNSTNWIELFRNEVTLLNLGSEDSKTLYDGIYSTGALWNGVLSIYTKILNTNPGIYEEAIIWKLGNYSTSSGSITTSILQNDTYLYNITAYPNNLNISQSYLNYNVSNDLKILFPVLNISIKQLYTNQVINNFSSYLSNLNINITKNTTSGFIIYYLTNNTIFNYTVLLDNYNSNTSTITTNTNSILYINTTIYLTSQYQIFTNFIDENTRDPVLNVNYSIIGEVFGYNLSTSNGLFNFTIPSDGLYEIRYSADGYSDRSYFINIPAVIDDINITLYLLSDNISNNFIVKVTDTINNPIPGIIVSLMRRYLINNQTQYKVVEEIKPSITLKGSAPFTAVPNTVAYLFRVRDSDGNILYQGSGTTATNLETLYLIDQELFIRINVQGEPFKVSKNLLGFSSSFSNSSDTFWLSYSDSNLVTDQVCLNVYENNTLFLGQSCSFSKNSILSFKIPTVKNGSYYTGKASLELTDNSTYLENILIIDKRNKVAVDTFGIMGIFILLCTLLFIGTAFAKTPALAILLSVFAFVAYGPFMLGLVAVPIVLQGTLIMISIIILILIREK